MWLQAYDDAQRSRLKYYQDGGRQWTRLSEKLIQVTVKVKSMVMQVAVGLPVFPCLEARQYAGMR